MFNITQSISDNSASFWLKDYDNWVNTSGNEAVVVQVICMGTHSAE
jgi:hypothetical protein